MPKKKTTTRKKKTSPKVAKTKKVKDKKAEKKEKKEEKEKYFEAVGKRKTSTAIVRMWTKGGKEFLVNGKTLEDYFPTKYLQKTALASLERMKCTETFKISVLVKGGGISSQAEAVRHATAKALVDFNPEFRKRLKKAGFLTRDSRMRERKKFGLKRARRAPQWKKR